jgi:hypothetical protein
MYQSMFLGQSGMLGVKELWKVKALPLLCMACNPRPLLDHGPCVLCNQGIESIINPLLACVFRIEILFKVLAKCGRYFTVYFNSKI